MHTCPLVTKVHMEVIRHGRANRDIILIGHEGHPEVEEQWEDILVKMEKYIFQD